jgi:hypothetical protein
MHPSNRVSKRFDSIQEGDHSVSIHNFNGKAPKVSKSEAYALLDKVSTLQSVYRGTTLVARKESQNSKTGKKAVVASSSTQDAKPSTSFFSNSLRAVRNFGRYFTRQPVRIESEKPVEPKRATPKLDLPIDLSVDVNPSVENDLDDQSEIVTPTPKASIDSDTDETVDSLDKDTYSSETEDETDEVEYTAADLRKLAASVSDSDSDDEETIVENTNQQPVEHFMVLRNGKEVHYNPELAKKYVYFAPSFRGCKYEVISTK